MKTVTEMLTSTSRVNGQTIAICLPILVLIGMLTLSYYLRSPVLEKTTGAPNIEASYHVLLTATALSESPMRNHWLLPTVSLGQLADKHIPWGAAIPTPTGDYIYTSFTPPAFLLPYVLFSAFQLEPSVHALVKLNFTLQALSCFLLYLLLVRLLTIADFSPSVTRAAALVGVSVQIFSLEALLSFGIVYWSQQIYQIVLIGMLLIVTIILERNATDTRKLVAGLTVLAFLGAWTEWTGFIFNGGLVILFWLKSRQDVRYRAITIQLLLATVIAGLLIVVHYALAAGVLPTLKAITGRFIARSNHGGSNFYRLLTGYFLSYGTLLFLLPVAIFASLRTVGWKRWLEQRGIAGFVLIAAILSLGENVLMMQHASEFSFDRLKAIVPAAILFAFAFARLFTPAKTTFLILLAAAFAQNIWSYERTLDTYAAWELIDRNNRLLVSEIEKVTDVSCADIASNMKIRGYANLLFHRGIRENVEREAWSDTTPRVSHCSSVYLQGELAFTDLPRFTSALVYKNGTTHILDAP